MCIGQKHPNICWVECELKWSFPFFTSTTSVGKGCYLIAQCKPECWESCSSNKLTLSRDVILLSQHELLLKKRMVAGYEYMVFVNLTSRCPRNAERCKKVLACKNRRTLAVEKSNSHLWRSVLFASNSKVRNQFQVQSTDGRQMRGCA